MAVNRQFLCLVVGVAEIFVAVGAVARAVLVGRNVKPPHLAFGHLENSGTNGGGRESLCCSSVFFGDTVTTGDADVDGVAAALGYLPDRKLGDYTQQKINLSGIL